MPRLGELIGLPSPSGIELDVLHPSVLIKEVRNLMLGALIYWTRTSNELLWQMMGARSLSKMSCEGVELVVVESKFHSLYLYRVMDLSLNFI